MAKRINKSANIFKRATKYSAKFWRRCGVQISQIPTARFGGSLRNQFDVYWSGGCRENNTYQRAVRRTRPSCNTSQHQWHRPPPTQV